MKKLLVLLAVIFFSQLLFAWGFFMHKQINYHAVFLLPPEMLVLYKPNIDFLSEHAVDPDKRRYAVATEGSHHYIDIDHYGRYPFPLLPRNWDDAVARYTRDSLQAHGIVPWWILIMKQRLTKAFKDKDQIRILRLSADIGHYIADAHVPLHASSNHNGQLTNQLGIHGFWESRIPELFAEKDWDFFIGKAVYISHPAEFIWKRLLESSAAADSVLSIEKKLSLSFPEDKRYTFEDKNGTMTRQYAEGYAAAYDRAMNYMVERRMRLSIFAVASFWYTCWVDAGQPDLSRLIHKELTESEMKEMQEMALQWKGDCELN